MSTLGLCLRRHREFFLPLAFGVSRATARAFIRVPFKTWSRVISRLPPEETTVVKRAFGTSWMLSFHPFRWTAGGYCEARWYYSSLRPDDFDSPDIVHRGAGLTIGPVGFAFLHEEINRRLVDYRFVDWAIASEHGFDAARIEEYLA